MLCLDVLRNGKRIALAGVRRGSVSATINWADYQLGSNRDALSERSVVPGLTAWVGGLNAARPLRREHLYWVRLRRLNLGDEFSIRVVQSERATTPSSREPVPNSRYTKSGSLDQCSFCRRWRGDREADAPSMAGRGVTTICAQCAFVAAALVEEKGVRALHLRELHDSECSFCRKKRARLVRSKKATVCTLCLKRFMRHF